MKLAVKRVYCPNDHMLVHPKEQADKSTTRILCSRCGRELYSFNGVRWNVSVPRKSAVK